MAETFTYDESFPTDMDRVRALIPDKATPWLLSNEQINLILSYQSDVRLAAADCCDMIVAELGRYAQDKTISSGAGVSISRDRSPDYFKERSNQLRNAVQGGEPFYGADAFDYSKDEYGNDNSEYLGE